MIRLSFDTKADPTPRRLGKLRPTPETQGARTQLDKQAEVVHYPTGVQGHCVAQALGIHTQRAPEDGHLFLIANGRKVQVCLKVLRQMSVQDRQTVPLGLDGDVRVFQDFRPGVLR